jgi:hypothetical protein
MSWRVSARVEGPPTPEREMAFAGQLEARLDERSPRISTGEIEAMEASVSYDRVYTEGKRRTPGIRARRKDGGANAVRSS